MSSTTHRITVVVVAAGLLAAACTGTEPGTGAAGTDPAVSTEVSAEVSTAPTTGDAASTTAPSEPPPDTTAAPVVPAITEDRSYYVLPPGNYGGLPTTDESTDQLALYDGLTPLRGEVTDADLDEFFLPMDFAPVGTTIDEPTGRDDVSIVYDEFGVPHVTGETREAMAFGAGWVTARDRGLLIDLGRGPSRASTPSRWSPARRASCRARRPNNSSPTRSGC